MSSNPHKPRALIIDDEQVIANTLAVILRMHGYDADAVYSGEEALEAVESVHPDIVLSDIRMRQINGVQAAVRIRQSHPDCRVILFTATPLNETEREKIQDLGFEFLQRPLHPSTLLAQLSR